MPYQVIRVHVPGYYYWKNGRRIHVRGHYKYIRVWVPLKRRLITKKSIRKYFG